MKSQNNSANGKLFIVGTPIGNLGDITVRALDALTHADAIYAEDTRVTSRLLSHYSIEKPLFRLDENVIRQKASEVVEKVRDGKTIAFCTDAGMPGVSDPGAELIRCARDGGVEVEVLPGPSAAVLAYVNSAPDNAEFYFGGFMPRKHERCIRLLESLKSLDAALIFYESPNRLCASLEAIAEVFPHRRVTVCREMTKLHEEIDSAGACELAQRYAQRQADSRVRGEIAIVVDGPHEIEAANDRLDSEAKAKLLAEKLSREGASAKDMRDEISKRYGLSRNEAYAIAMEARKEKDS
ncbi:MAG: 16S rRNA (cytidine(1402)-2'-O)-methyltransferase [Eggerthellaceae bacterium]|nr:16S rRNA (cytidine(1402)-2'-O)-methyltransferase [Eggerthellaceae bacterium]